NFQPSFERNEILIDYVRFTKFKRDDTIRLSHMPDFLPTYNLQLAIPKAFNDKYFSEDKVKNLIELKDIIFK
ncbi:16436_t:CDS:2, partial [Funneliformis caledonium]